MALKALLLRKKLDGEKKALADLYAQRDAIQEKETELEAAIEELPEDAPEEDRSAVEEEVENLESEKTENEEKIRSLEERVEEIEKDLAAEEEKQETEAEPEPAAEPEAAEERKEEITMNTRSMRHGMTYEQRAAFVQREDVQAFLGEVRTCIKEKRALTNAGLVLPEVVIGILRENIMEYSKLYKHVNVQSVSGSARQVVMGTVPEAVWTEMCANINELDLSFYGVEVDGYKVGGFFAVCNALAEDNDVDLLDKLIEALGQAIGLALDKAILYGTGTKMPIGVVTRLAQTAKPADYPDNARPWVDLHSTNITTIASTVQGEDLFPAIVTAFAPAKGGYSRGEKVFAMNETTYTKLIAAALSVDQSGAIVAGLNGSMPGIGGYIEVLNFIPDNVIIGGYFDLYLLAERAGTKIAQSEHARFIEDQTVLKGTARYDGQPSIAEGFVAIGINSVTPDATMTFAPDTANTQES